MRTARFEREETARTPAKAENICGVLIHARQGRTADVASGVAAMAGAEVHHVTGDDRLIVTVEDIPERPASDSLTALHDIPHVLSVALVYHEQCEEPDEPVEETWT